MWTTRGQGARVIHDNENLGLEPLPIDPALVNRGTVTRPGYRRPSDSLWLVERLPHNADDDAPFAGLHNRGPHDPWWERDDRPEPSTYDRQAAALIRGAIAAVVLLAMFAGAGILYWLSSANAPRLDPPPTREIATPSGVTTLSPEEAATVEMVSWEVWDGEQVDALVITLAAPDLPYPLARGPLLVTVLDDAQTEHQLDAPSVSVRPEATSVAVIPLANLSAESVAEVEVRFFPTIAFTEVPAYEVTLTDVEADYSRSLPWLRGTLVAAPGDGLPPGSVSITTLLRGPDGALRNIGYGGAHAPAPGESVEVEIVLLSPQGIRSDDALEHHLNTR